MKRTYHILKRLFVVLTAPIWFLFALIGLVICCVMAVIVDIIYWTYTGKWKGFSDLFI